MMERPRRVLPMVSVRDPRPSKETDAGTDENPLAAAAGAAALTPLVRLEAQRILSEGALEPDPQRVADGWERRFVAQGERAEEMMRLYRDLGFQVAADPVRPDDLLGPDCDDCQVAAAQHFTVIYTRRLGAPTSGEGMTTNETTAVLRDEHRRILQVVAAIERTLDVHPGPLDMDTIEKGVRFFQLFADACHHGKEEDLLFPELESRGMSRDSGPLAVMLHEHRLGREHVRAMSEATAGARQGDERATENLVAAGRDYIDLIRGHIMKEDHVLFNMADRMVDAVACRQLCTAYDEVCERTFEGCTKAQLEALAAEIEAAVAAL